MKTVRGVFVLLVFAAGSMFANASFSFTGNFGTDDAFQVFDFTVSTTSIITLETLSYGGGTNSANIPIPPGGFDPRLTWFQADGTQIGFDNGGHCGSTNTYLGACNDAFFQGTLAAGSYLLVLTQDGNDSLGNFSDGFSEVGNPNFTANPPCPMFCDSLSGNQLDGHWAVDILSVQAATELPEPGAVGLTAAGLSLLILALRKR
jgi:hypothetical protein